MRNAYKILVGIPERSRYVWEDNIQMNLKVRSEHMEWIHVSQDRVQWWALVNTR
jgi:hypothetical protein